MGSNDRYYVQCELRSGSAKDIVWIPDKFAEVGKMLMIDGYKNGWVVSQVFESSKKTKKEVNEKSRDYLKQREASDI
jgi:hypothetical protein